MVRCAFGGSSSVLDGCCTCLVDPADVGRNAGYAGPPLSRAPLPNTRGPRNGYRRPTRLEGQPRGLGYGPSKLFIGGRSAPIASQLDSGPAAHLGVAAGTGAVAAPASVLYELAVTFHWPSIFR